MPSSGINLIFAAADLNITDLSCPPSSDEDRVKTELEKVTDRKDELEQKYENMITRIEALENLTWEDAMKEY